MNDDLIKKYYDAAKDSIKDYKKEKAPAIYETKIECDLRCLKKCTYDPMVGVVKTTTDGSGKKEIDGTTYDNVGPYYCPKWFSDNEVGFNYIELAILIAIVVVVLIIIIVIACLACKYRKAKNNSIAVSANGLRPIVA